MNNKKFSKPSNSTKSLKSFTSPSSPKHIDSQKIFKNPNKIDNKMGDFLVGLDNYISEETKNQKDFLEAMDKKIAPLKEEKKRGRIEEIVIYSEKEKKQFINDYKNGIKNFYTYKGSGKEYLEKKLKLKKMEEI